jgi:hypothetical protein
MSVSDVDGARACERGWRAQDREKVGVNEPSARPAGAIGLRGTH